MELKNQWRGKVQRRKFKKNIQDFGLGNNFFWQKFY